MQKPETKFRNRFRKRLDAIPNSWFESIQQKSINGTPDILGCVNGYFVALELKATHKSPVTELQNYKLKKIYDAGGFRAIVHPENMEDVLENLIRLTNYERPQCLN